MLFTFSESGCGGHGLSTFCAKLGLNISIKANDFLGCSSYKNIVVNYYKCLYELSIVLILKILVYMTFFLNILSLYNKQQFPFGGKKNKYFTHKLL